MLSSRATLSSTCISSSCGSVAAFSFNTPWIPVSICTSCDTSLSHMPSTFRVNYMDHNYIGHDCIGHSHIGHKNTLARAAPAGSLRALLFSGCNKPHTRHIGHNHMPSTFSVRSKTRIRDSSASNLACQSAWHSAAISAFFPSTVVRLSTSGWSLTPTRSTHPQSPHMDTRTPAQMHGPIHVHAGKRVNRLADTLPLSLCVAEKLHRRRIACTRWHVCVCVCFGAPARAYVRTRARASVHFKLLQKGLPGACWSSVAETLVAPSSSSCLYAATCRGCRPATLARHRVG